MHKNSFNPKSLIGNWHENRYTDEYDAQSDATSNTYLQNACKWPQTRDKEMSLSIFRSNSHLFLRFLSSAYNKYVPISRAVGNNPNYNKVSWLTALQPVVHPSRGRLLTWTLNDPFLSPCTGEVRQRNAELDELLARFLARWNFQNHEPGQLQRDGRPNRTVRT